MVCISTSSLKYTKPYLLNKKKKMKVGTRHDGNKLATSKSRSLSPQNSPFANAPAVRYYFHFLYWAISGKEVLYFVLVHLHNNNNVSVASKSPTFVTELKYMSGLLDLPSCRFHQQKVCLVSFCPPVKYIHLKVSVKAPSDIR